METDKNWNDNPLNTNPYFCNLCKVYCASAVNLQTHFLGNKHKAVENALKSHGIVKTLSASGEPSIPLESLPDYIQTEPVRDLGKTLQEQLDSCRDTEPALGLQYVTEYQSEGSLLYECDLCWCQTGLTNMFMHVLGIKHRMAYLKKHYPEMGEVKGRGSNLNRKLRDIAAKIEQDEGRKQIKVTTDLPIRKDDRYSVQLPDSLVTWFAEDDVGTENKKETPKPEEQENTKKPEEASKDAEAKVQDSNKSEGKEKQDQNTEQRENAEFKETDLDSEEFTDNEDLLMYLQSFEIVDEDDASFILKVTQKLTNSLVVYRQKISERKNSYELNPEGRVDDQSEPSSSTSAKVDGPNIGFSSKRPPVQQSCEDNGAKLNTKSSFKRKVSHLNANSSEDNAKNRKCGTFMSTFKELPDEQTFTDTEMQEPPTKKQVCSFSNAEEQDPSTETQDLPVPAKIKDPPAKTQDTPSCDAKMQDLPVADIKVQDSSVPDVKMQDPPSLDVKTQNLSTPDDKKQDPLPSQDYLLHPTSDKSSSFQNMSEIPSVCLPEPSISEGHVIANFFSSIRNMEVDEVASTLHKIAASNPAFSGMDVQNVIKILTESGNLKPKNTTSAS